MDPPSGLAVVDRRCHQMVVRGSPPSTPARPVEVVQASSTIPRAASDKIGGLMPQLSASARARLPNTAFAYVDSKGQRRLPIHDESHVRNALARFNQIKFEDDAARERARKRLLTAGRRHGMGQ